MVGTRCAGLMAGIAVIAAAACGRGSTSGSRMDDGLRSDLAEAGASGLELAPSTGRQVVVSPIEGGPRATPAAAPHRARRPVQQPRRQTVVARRAAAPARAPAPAPTRRQVEARVAAPSATPASPAQPQRSGGYSTEAEIFRQMPWIRP